MSSRLADCIIAIAIISGAIFLLWQLEGVPKEGYIFPSILLYSMIFCSVIIFSRALLKKDNKTQIVVFENVPAEKWITVVFIFISYVIGMFHIGFFVSTFIASFAITTILSINRKGKTLSINAIFSLSLVLVFYVFFVRLMKVRFPDALFM